LAADGLVTVSLRKSTIFSVMVANYPDVERDL